MKDVTVQKAEKNGKEGYEIVANSLYAEQAADELGFDLDAIYSSEEAERIARAIIKRVDEIVQQGAFYAGWTSGNK